MVSGLYVTPNLVFIRRQPIGRLLLAIPMHMHIPYAR